ncbi:hypothetical protein BJV78DRAFT_1208959 [Lactifluus subvellereus]|nr:hypothetical protein BJV78DRAFT_1208959 [Lactifluus subvellereus]
MTDFFPRLECLCLVWSRLTSHTRDQGRASRSTISHDLYPGIMGFFQKFLSLGSRKNKKRRAALTLETRSLPLSRDSEEMRRLQEEQEEVASRLLRSSSLRYAVVSEVDYSSLPPLPHPINSLRQTPMAPPSRSASIQTRRTYTVTVRDRKVEALTEFPNANPPLDTPTRPFRDGAHPSGEMSRLHPITPKDQNRLHILRQDPSVASLLDMYDNHGRLDSKAFSNTPSAPEKSSSKDGAAQVKRSGSTLRQLLGSPGSTSHTNTTEGDISWAEGLLRETRLGSDHSTESSFQLENPWDMVCGNDVPHGGDPDTTSSSSQLENPWDIVFGNDVPHDGHPDATSSSDSPHPIDSSTYPTISSMTVEPSYTSDENPAPPPKRAPEPELRPAAEVFGFLLEKRRPRNSISTSKAPQLAVHPANQDFDSSTNRVHTVPVTPSQPSSYQPAEASASTDTPSTVGSILFDPPHTATILNHTRIPVAPGRLAENSRPGQLTVTAIATRSRIPHERRSLRIPNSTLKSTSEIHLPSTSPTEPIEPTLATGDVLHSTTNAAEKESVVPSHLSFRQGAALAPAPMRSAHRRSVSYSSGRPNWGTGPGAVVRTAHVKGLKLDNGKENNASLTSTIENASLHSFGHPKSRLPVTPFRERALLSPIPSPASSSELSPLGQKMMADMRKQRQARGERRKNRLAAAAVAHV